MTGNHQSQYHSPLEQSLTRDGITLQIKIYKSGDSDWNLEVVDEHGTSTYWKRTFLSDTEALALALKTIENEGAMLFVGNTSDSPAPSTEAGIVGFLRGE